MINLTVGLVCNNYRPLENNYCYYLKELCYRLAGNSNRDQCVYMCKEEYEITQSFFEAQNVIVFSPIINNEWGLEDNVITIKDEIRWNLAGESYDEIMKLVQGFYRIGSFRIDGIEFIIKSLELNKVYDEDDDGNNKVFTA